MSSRSENVGSHRSRSLRKAYWAGAIILLLVPLIAMQFTDEVNWDVADFVIFGVLLIGVGITYELAARKTGNAAFKTAIGLAIFAAFLQFWMNGAVGIIGSEDNDVNLMFYGVLLIALIGFLVSRFDPLKLAIAMRITAGAQALVFVIALVMGWGFTGPLTAFFMAMWLGAARLFQKAGRDAERAKIARD